MRVRKYDGPERHPDALPHDVRDWSVETRLDGRTVGSVSDVLVGEDGRSRFVEVTLEDDDRHVLLPTGHARIDPEDETIHLPGLNRDAFGSIPDYDRDPATVTDDYERRLGAAWDTVYRGDQYYDSPAYRPHWNSDEDASAVPTRVDSLDDVDVADHDPDPRGWTVTGRDGSTLGTVDHLLGDTAAMKVRYLVLDVDDELVDTDRKVLIPVGHATLDEDDERVRVPALDRTSVGDCPVWTGGAPDRVLERSINDHIERGYRDDARQHHPRYRPLRAPATAGAAG